MNELGIPKPEKKCHCLKENGRVIAYCMHCKTHRKPLKRSFIKRGKAPNKVRKTSIGAEKRKADKLFADYIKRGQVCQLAGIDHIICNGYLQCMHIITRSNHKLRFDPSNALAGCAAHHYYYTNNPWDWNELIRTHFYERYTYVNEKRYLMIHRKLKDYQELNRWLEVLK